MYIYSATPYEHRDAAQRLCNGANKLMSAIAVTAPVRSGSAQCARQSFCSPCEALYPLPDANPEPTCTAFDHPWSIVSPGDRGLPQYQPRDRERILLQLFTSASVQGFGRRPAHEVSNTHHGLSAGVRKPPGNETAGGGCPISRRYGNLSGAAGAAMVLRNGRRGGLLMEDRAVGCVGACFSGDDELLACQIGCGKDEKERA